jgi:hypothetical protein
MTEETEKRGPGRPPKVVEEPRVQAVVLRDFWVAADEAGRVRAGTVIEVTKDELITGLERGIMKRYEG